MNKKTLSTLAFISLMIFAVLEILTGLQAAGVNIFGTTILSALSTVKNVCIILVIGFLSYEFTIGKPKGWLIAYIVALVVFVVGTILLWI